MFAQQRREHDVSRSPQTRHGVEVTERTRRLRASAPPVALQEVQGIVARVSRLSARVLLLLGVTFVATALFGLATASAHNPEITASVDCEGLVSYTAVSWAGGATDAARTNPNIGVWYSTDGGATFTQLPHEPAHQFNAGNGFEFSDSFQLPAPLPAAVIVRAQAQANWGDGAGPGSARQTEVLTLPPCPPTTTTSAPETTTTSVADTTTTTAPEETTTTTLAEAPTTTAPAPTTSIGVAGVTSTTAPPGPTTPGTAGVSGGPAATPTTSVTVGGGGGGGLPVTGSDAAPVALLGVVLLAAGALLHTAKQNRAG